MASVNRVFIVGNLGKDPEVVKTPSGILVATMSVATSSKWQDKKTGEQKEETEWHRIITVESSAKFVQQYLKKGMKVHVDGRIRTRKWTDKQGVEQKITEIFTDRVLSLEKAINRPPEPPVETFDESIPF